MMELTTFFSLLSDSDKRVEALREYASMLSVPDYSTLIIRYTHHDGRNWVHEYATAIPLTRQTYKRSYDDSLSPAVGHARWVTTQYYTSNVYNLDPSRSLHFEELGENTFAVEEGSIACHSRDFCWQEPPDMFASSGPESFCNVDVEAWIESEQRFRRKMDFKWLAGDPTTCALFASASSKNYEHLRSSVRSQRDLPTESFRKAIKHEYVDPGSILNYLTEFLEMEKHSSLLKSLRALATVTNIYKMLPDATVSLGATSQPLYKALWAQQAGAQAEKGTVMLETTHNKFSALPTNWASTFSCIVFLESGSLNIPPSCFENVMALSARNSIYIAAPLLCDPSENPASFEIRRIRGNVGKPGLAMLIPPPDPRIRRLEDEDWHLVTHADFDGQRSDSFHQASLHLSFTGCAFPIDTQSYGSRDIEIYFLESVVSVHDKGQWVADLDILSDLRSPKIIRSSAICCHEPSSEGSAIQNSDFTMVDT
ncbi:hypothetical protein F4861DRAFT_158272 [Xylaria intraflava]|nr:hypothetical protein F4861DRAFT_158272 [Xylaria intraflava]